MNKFLNLLKIELINTYNYNINKKKKIAFSTIILLYAGIGLFLSITYNQLFYELFKSINIISYYPMIVIFILMILIFITTIYKSNYILFSSKDQELLASLPISKKIIISVKLTLLYLEELVASFLLFAPTIVLYSLYDLHFIYLGLILLFTIPLFLILISSLIGFIISFLATKIKFAKTIYTALYIIIFVAFMIFIFAFQQISTQDSTNIINSIDKIVKYLPFLDLIIEGFIYHNSTYIFIYLIITLLSSLILILVYAKFSTKFYAILNQSKNKRVLKEINIKKASQLAALLKNDLKRLTSNTYALLNTLIGPIISIVIIILTFMQINKIENNPELINIMPKIYEGLYLVFLVFGAMSSYTSTCINLEKDNFYIIKTLPISKKNYFISKIIVNQIIVGAAVFISTIILCIVYKLNIFVSLITIFFPQLYILMCALFGLFINLAFPRLNWENNQQLKNSPSQTIYTISVMFFTMLVTVIGYVFIFAYNFYISVLFCLLLTLALLALFILLLKYKANILFLKIS